MAQPSRHDSLDTIHSTLDSTHTSSFEHQDQSVDMPELPTPSEVRAKHNGNSFGTVSFPDRELFVKYGPPHKASIDEAQTLQALRQAFPNNEVPIPQLRGWRTEEGINYIYMSLIPGSTLESVWSTLSVSEKDRIATQVKQIVASLRSLGQQPENRFIGSVRSGPVKDIWFQGNENAGPLRTTKQFNDLLQHWSLNGLRVSQGHVDPLRSMLPDSSRICFTHSDLHLRNILVSGETGSRGVVGVVDWGQAGWYPEYWEYCKALLLTGHQGWYSEGWLLKVLDPYDDEYDGFVGLWQRRPA